MECLHGYQGSNQEIASRRAIRRLICPAKRIAGHARVRLYERAPAGVLQGTAQTTRTGHPGQRRRDHRAPGNPVRADPADRATIEEEHALELRTRDRERKLLKKVQQSIARIDSGEYGWCEETGEPIGIPACWPAPRPPCRWKRRNAAKCVKNSTAIELFRAYALPQGAATDRKVGDSAPSATRFRAPLRTGKAGSVRPR